MVLFSIHVFFMSILQIILKNRSEYHIDNFQNCFVFSLSFFCILYFKAVQLNQLYDRISTSVCTLFYTKWERMFIVIKSLTIFFPTLVLQSNFSKLFIKYSNVILFCCCGHRICVFAIFEHLNRAYDLWIEYIFNSNCLILIGIEIECV